MKAMLLAILLSTACTSSPARATPSATAATAAHPTAPRGADVQVLVTLSGARPMADVARDLEQRGLVVERRLEKADIVTGHVPRDAMASLRGVSGVTAVEEDVPVQLPPPGAPQ